MTGHRSAARLRLFAFSLSIFALVGNLPVRLLGAPTLHTLEVSIRSGQDEVYTLVPGQLYHIDVSSDDPNLSQLRLSLAGPQKTGLTSSFEIVWNESGFHDLGSSLEDRLLVVESSSASGNTWTFSIVLPNQTTAGVWEARAETGGVQGVAGFQVSLVHWNFTVLSSTPFTNAVPGKIATSTIEIGVSCNGDLLLNLSCSGLTAPGGFQITPDRILVDDDPVHPQITETGKDPQDFAEGFIEGPIIQGGIDRKAEIYLFLQIPNPMKRDIVQGRISVEFEALNESIATLVDAYIHLLRHSADGLKPPEPVGIEYAADLDTASHMSGLVFPLDIKLKQLRVLEEAGVHTIRLTPAYDIFLHQYEPKIADLDSLISQIRDDGKKVMIADAAAEEYWTSPMDWNSFSQAFIQRVGNLAARYEPDYYIVVKEPSWYLGMSWTGPAGMLTETTTVDQWVTLTQQLCDAVKQASPGTLTGVAVALPYQQSLNYLMEVDELENLDFVGVDVYRLFHLGILEEYLPQLSKPKWILETWDGNPDEQEGEIWRRTTSAEWIMMMSRYAQSKGFEGMATFFNLYLCYDYSGKPTTLDQVRDALDDRQESFYVLRRAIAESVE